MTKKKTHNEGLFNQFATHACDLAGNKWAFISAFIIIILWVITGPVFRYSDTWQLIINTGTTIITFLMVFLIQHTQNRDMIIMNLKLDELIKSHKEANNSSIDLGQLSDKDLKILEKKYTAFCKAKEKSK